MRAQVETDLRRHFVLDRIAEAEGLSVSEQELVGAVEQMARESGRSAGEVVQHFQEDPARLSELKTHLLHGKAREALRRAATLVEEAAPPRRRSRPRRRPPRRASSIRSPARSHAMDASTFTPPAGFSSQPSAGEPRAAGDLSVPSRELEGAARAEYYIPVVVERTGRGERSWDIYSRLLEDRIIFIGSPIGDGLANAVIAQLLYLQKADKARDIHVYVNSPGGSVSAGLAIYDTMQYVSCPVETVCVGMAASMAAILLAGGTARKRFALPNARIMIHQPWGGVQGTAADIAIEAERDPRR